MIRPLSYSSATLLQNCPRKYWHYKINETPIDIDADKSTAAFDIGKAFHKVLEDTKHEFSKFRPQLVLDACKEFNCEDEALKIHAMLLKYYELHKEIGLQCVACETEISTTDFIGYVDAILINPYTKGWWICDIKTAARLDKTLVAKLNSDVQLNLYACFKDALAKQLNLEVDNFRGVRYRVTTKSKLKQKSSEKLEDYIQRVFHNIESVDVPIKAEMLRPQETWDRFKFLHETTLDLDKDNPEGAIQNFSNCNSYFRPCEYWSNCHGACFTNNTITVLDIDNVRHLKASTKN